MFSKIFYWLSISLIFTQCVTFPGRILADDAHKKTNNDEKEQNYEQKLERLSQTIQQLEKELSKTKDSRNQLQQALKKSEQEIAGLLKNIQDTGEALAREKKQLAQLNGQKLHLEALRKEQSGHISEVVRQAYLLGKHSQIRLLFSQEQPDKMLRLLRYHDYFLSAHKTKIDEYSATLEKVRVLANRIETKQTSLQTQNAILKKQHDELEKQQLKRRESLAAFKIQLKKKGESLEQLFRDREHLERLIGEALLAIENIQMPQGADSFANQQGKLSLPSSGRIVQHYGSSRMQGRLRWQGVLIAGNIGDEIRAIHHGRVIFSDYLRGQGLLIILDHGDGYMSLYAHNQMLFKEIGDWVENGESIASMGNSGGQDQVALYFEIRHHGKPKDPRLWLKNG